MEKYIKENKRLIDLSNKMNSENPNDSENLYIMHDDGRELVYNNKIITSMKYATKYHDNVSKDNMLLYKNLLDEFLTLKHDLICMYSREIRFRIAFKQDYVMSMDSKEIIIKTTAGLNNVYARIMLLQLGLKAKLFTAHDKDDNALFYFVGKNDKEFFDMFHSITYSRIINANCSEENLSDYENIQDAYQLLDDIKIGNYYGDDPEWHPILEYHLDFFHDRYEDHSDDLDTTEYLNLTYKGA